MDVNDKIFPIVQSTLGSKHTEAISNMLKSIAEAFDSMGCAIWEIVPDSVDVANPQSGEMFVMASWLKTGDIFAYHELPIDGSIVGKALHSHKIETTADLPEEGKLNKENSFFQDTSIKKMMAVIITLGKDIPAVISLFRTAKQPDYSKTDKDNIQKIKTIIPHLFQAIQNQMGFELIRDIDKLLQDEEAIKRKRPIKSEEIEIIFYNLNP